MKFANDATMTAAALATRSGVPLAATSRVVTARLVASETIPLAALKESQRLRRPCDGKPGHVTRSCHKKLCDTAVRTAKATAAGTGSDVQRDSAASVASWTKKPATPTRLNRSHLARVVNSTSSFVPGLTRTCGEDCRASG